MRQVDNLRLRCSLCTRPISVVDDKRRGVLGVGKGWARIASGEPKGSRPRGRGRSTLHDQSVRVLLKEGADAMAETFSRDDLDRWFDKDYWVKHTTVPTAGKTIMAGLLIKELIVCGDLQRCLIVPPGSRSRRKPESTVGSRHGDRAGVAACL